MPMLSEQEQFYQRELNLKKSALIFVHQAHHFLYFGYWNIEASQAKKSNRNTFMPFEEGFFFFWDDDMKYKILLFLV